MNFYSTVSDKSQRKAHHLSPSRFKSPTSTSSNKSFIAVAKKRSSNLIQALKGVVFWRCTLQPSKDANSSTRWHLRRIWKIRIHHWMPIRVPSIWKIVSIIPSRAVRKWPDHPGHALNWQEMELKSSPSWLLRVIGHRTSRSAKRSTASRPTWSPPWRKTQPPPWSITVVQVNEVSRCQSLRKTAEAVAQI